MVPREVCADAGPGDDVEPGLHGRRRPPTMRFRPPLYVRPAAGLDHPELRGQESGRPTASASPRPRTRAPGSVGNRDPCALASHARPPPAREVRLGAPAKAMGFEMSPPAYLSLNSPTKMEAGFAGVNYASATSGIWRDIDTGLDIPLMDQVKNFADTIGQMRANRSQQELSKMMSNSLFLVAIGTSDLYLIYNINNNGGSDSKTDVPHLISSYGDSLTALYNLGARKFGIINVPTLCTAVVRHGCEGLITSLREEFNDGIKSLMAGLASNLSGLRYSIADFHAFSDAVNMNPSTYGFVNTGGACCQGSCAPGSGLPCANRSRYWYWDEEYPTEQTAKLAASAFSNGTTQFTTPMNFKMLINQK